MPIYHSDNPLIYTLFLFAVCRLAEEPTALYFSMVTQWVHLHSHAAPSPLSALAQSLHPHAGDTLSPLPVSKGLIMTPPFSSSHTTQGEQDYAVAWQAFFGRL